MKKNVRLLTTAATAMMLAGVFAPLTTAQAAVAGTNTAPTSTVSNPKQARTAIITAKGTLQGQLVPYIRCVPNTGKVTLHYTAQNCGFVDGDIAYLTIKLPEQFKYLASQPEFASYITGEMRETRLFGDNTQPINPSNVTVYTDRIIVEVPRSFWIGVGDVNADIVIDYGQLLEENHHLPVDSAPTGYEFIAHLQYSSAPWDLLKAPIIGTNNDTIFTSETDAIY